MKKDGEEEGSFLFLGILTLLRLFSLPQLIHFVISGHLFRLCSLPTEVPLAKPLFLLKPNICSRYTTIVTVFTVR